MNVTPLLLPLRPNLFHLVFADTLSRTVLLLLRILFLLRSSRPFRVRFQRRKPQSLSTTISAPLKSKIRSQSSSKPSCAGAGKKRDRADMGNIFAPTCFSRTNIFTGASVNSLILRQNYVPCLVIQNIKPNSAKPSSRSRHLFLSLMRVGRLL